MSTPGSLFSSLVGVSDAIYFSKMAALVCLDDYEQLAKDKLDRNAYNYYSSGASNQQTLRDNVQAFKRYKLYTH